MYIYIYDIYIYNDKYIYMDIVSCFLDPNLNSCNTL